MASGIFRLLVTLCGLLALSCAPPARPPSVQALYRIRDPTPRLQFRRVHLRTSLSLSFS